MESQRESALLQRYEGALAYTKQILPRLSSETIQAYVVANCLDCPELLEPAIALENDTWDDLSFLDFTAAHHAYYDKLLEQFPEYRLCMIDTETGELVATGMCVPLRADLDKPLSPHGWDWIV